MDELKKLEKRERKEKEEGEKDRGTKDYIYYFLKGCINLLLFVCLFAFVCV